jgi:hypothetical protein
MAKKSRFRSVKNTASAMMKRTEESARNTTGSNKWRDYIVNDFQGTKWKVSEGEHLIDIIPYLCGDNDPRFDSGTPTYFLDLWVHQRLGVTEDSYICPASNFKGQPCPICEHLSKMKSSGSFTDEELKNLTPKRRVLYNIICYDTPKEEDKGLQLWEASYFLTENELVDLARNRRDQGYHAFADPDAGSSISFIRKGKGQSTRYKGYAFEDRPEPISDDVLDEAYILDQLIHIPTYEELAEVFAPVAPEIDGGYDMGEDVPLGMGSDKPERAERAARPARQARTTGRRSAAAEPDPEPDQEPDPPKEPDPEPKKDQATRGGRRLGSTRRRG